jgi:tryptophan synthase alpha chain
MTRIAQRFALLARHGRKALIPYITAGDPNPSVTVPLMHALVRSGADLVELGVPFSDPMADGPVIQRASERALRHGVSLARVLAMVEEFRTQDAETPVVLMGYLNPIEVMGHASFAQRASAAGVDGVLTVDLPPEEAGNFIPALRKSGLDSIFLLAPTSDVARIRLISAASSGFIYYVSLRGVTGASHLDVSDVARRLKEIRPYTKLPLGVGFGINSPQVAASVAEISDAVIVGSAIVKRVEELSSQPERIIDAVPAFLASLRTAMDRSGLSPTRVTGVTR